MPAYEPFSPARTLQIVETHAAAEGPLLPILHAVQAAFGCIPPQATPLIAERLNLTRAEVHGVISFYHDFRSAPPGARQVRLCRAEACQARGAEALARSVLAALGLPADEPFGGTTADGAVSVEGVYCLGLCAVSPAALVDGVPLGRFDADLLLAAARA
jgi:formate dehydrogenase subunit gamma